MEFKDYYQIMGLKPDASQADIKRAYRKLARKYHPDVSSEQNAEENFKEVGEAYEVLKDPEKKASYDALRQQGWKGGESFRAPPNWNEDIQGNHQSNFSDFFDTLFGGGATRKQYRPFKESSFHGEDIYYALEIDLSDAYSGTTRTLQIPAPHLTQEGYLVQRQKTINVKIPKGVTNGQQIRLRGQGGMGFGEGSPGDLYLEIRIKPTKPFDIDGKDIIVFLPVSPWEAALGAKIKTPSLGGTIEVKIPPNSQTGTKLRLKGKGLPGNPPGDEYVVLQVVTPPVVSEEAKSLYQQMANKIVFNPREKLGI